MLYNNYEVFKQLMKKQTKNTTKQNKNKKQNKTKNIQIKPSCRLFYT